MTLGHMKQSRRPGPDMSELLANANALRTMYRAARQSARLPQVVEMPHLTSFPLMKLPLDVRMTVYEWLLKPENLEIRSARGNQQILQAGQNKFYALSLDVPEPQKLRPAILQTCKEVYAEARDVLYRPKRLTLAPGWITDPPNFPGFDYRGLAKIHRLESLHIQLNLRGGFLDKKVEHSKALIQQLNQSLVVRRISVVLEVIHLELALGRTPLKNEPAGKQRLLADQLAVLEVWRDALSQMSRGSEHVEILYKSLGKLKVTWKKVQGQEEWTFEEAGDEETATSNWRCLNKECYQTLIPAAQKMFEPRELRRSGLQGDESRNATCP